MRTDHIVLKKSKIISTGCTPTVLMLSTALSNHVPFLIGFDGKFVFELEILMSSRFDSL